MRLIYSIFITFMFVACGNSSSSSNNTKKLNDVAYVTVDAGTLEHKSTEVTGKGSIAFLDPTKDKGNSYAWTGSISDGGSLTLYANAEEKLKNGVELKFSRSAKALSVTISVAGEEIDVSSSFSSIDASSELSFQIDVHNDENPAHVLIWSKDAESFGGETALFNSEEDANTTGQGSGNIWGFALSGATVTSAAVSEPKFKDE